eukprot:g37379.t1
MVPASWLWEVAVQQQGHAHGVRGWQLWQQSSSSSWRRCKRELSNMAAPAKRHFGEGWPEQNSWGAGSVQAWQRSQGLLFAVGLELGTPGCWQG